MKNTLSDQWVWLGDLPAGTRVIAYNGTWIKLESDTDIVPGLYAHVNNGKTVHYSKLASTQLPPRIECRPSPFTS